MPGVRSVDSARAGVLGGSGETLHPEQSVLISFLSRASLIQIGPSWRYEEGRRISHSSLGQRGKPNFPPLLTGNHSLQKQSPGHISPGSILFPPWVDSYLSTGIRVVDYICLWAYLKLKERLNIQAEKHKGKMKTGLQASLCLC